MSALPRTPKVYTPQEGSTAWKVIQFLTSNPEEALSSSDIEAKFDKPAKQVHSILWAAIVHGVLKREEDIDGELLYRLGSGTPGVPAKPLAHPTLSSVVSSFREPGRSRRTRGVAPKIDLSAVEIEEGVEPDHPGRGGNDWLVLVDRMRPGQSCKLPRIFESSLRAFRVRLHASSASRIKVSKIDGEHVRVWRLE